MATVIALTSGTSWSVPADWDDSNNSIHCIGGGVDGVAGQGGNGSGFNGQRGGGGGAYSTISNLNLTPGGSVTYAVGTRGASTGGDTSQ